MEGWLSEKNIAGNISDNADHQDTLFGIYEELIRNANWDPYLVAIQEPKVPLQRSKHTWLVDCPKRPGITKKTFDFRTLFSLVRRIQSNHFDIIYFESLHTWNLPIMLTAGKAKTYQVIHEVIPHEGDRQVTMVDLMNRVVCRLADYIVLRNQTFISSLIKRYRIKADRVKYLELWRALSKLYTSKPYKTGAFFRKDQSV